MYNAEEKKYLALKMKFESELKEVRQKIEELTERRGDLELLLYSFDVTPEDLAEVEEEGEKMEKNPDNLVMNKNERDRMDSILIGVIRDNPGVKRSAIDLWFANSEDMNVNGKDVQRALERCKRRGDIAVRGKSKSAVWYVTPKGKKSIA